MTNVKKNQEIDRCEHCGSAITRRVYLYSMDVMHKPLCMEHQKAWREMNLPPKLAHFINNFVDGVNKGEEVKNEGLENNK